MSKRRRRNDSGSSSNRDRWLVTYADMITLVLVFFIIMYALSNVDAQKFRAMAASLSDVFGGGDIIYDSGANIAEEGISDSVGSEGMGAGELDIAEAIKLQQIKKEIEELIEEKGLGASVSITSEERGLVVSFMDPVLFELGSANLDGIAREIINEVGIILTNTDNYIRVEGHTDDLPISTNRFPSNWELSSARANSVVQELIHGSGLPPARLSAAAYGEYRPRAPNTTAENRQLNRRVNIVVLSSKYFYSEPEIID